MGYADRDGVATSRVPAAVRRGSFDEGAVQQCVAADEARASDEAAPLSAVFGRHAAVRRHGSTDRFGRQIAKKMLQWTDVVACLTLGGLAIRFGSRTGVWYCGLSLTAVSLPLWLVARYQLGTAFSARPVARHLVKRGLYARIRHPIYVFGSLAYFGTLLALQIWPILAAWLALTPIEVVRARREERVLAEAFGSEYQAYRRQTWF